MDWTMKEFNDANHNPVVVVNGDTTKEPIQVRAKVGTPVVLSALGTKDPDGNNVTYNWFYYPEATSAISKPVSPDEVIGKRGEDQLDVPPKVAIEDSQAEEARVLPKLPGAAHVLLVVEDDGVPSLTSYRRIVLDIEN
jgi:Cellulose-binding protein Sde0182, C-terminal domain